MEINYANHVTRRNTKKRTEKGMAKLLRNKLGCDKVYVKERVNYSN